MKNLKIICLSILFSLLIISPIYGNDTEIIFFNNSDHSVSDANEVEVEVDGEKVCSLKKKEYYKITYNAGRHRIGVQQKIDGRAAYGWAANVRVRKGRFYIQVDAKPTATTFKEVSHLPPFFDSNYSTSSWW